MLGRAKKYETPVKRSREHGITIQKHALTYNDRQTSIKRHYAGSFHAFPHPDERMEVRLALATWKLCGANEVSLARSHARTQRHANATVIHIDFRVLGRRKVSLRRFHSEPPMIGSEVGGVSPTGKSFRFVSCVRACVRAVPYVRSDSAKKVIRTPFPFSLLVSQPFPFSLSSNQVVSVS